jgi:chromatin remodeling complex protein RSC6
VLVLLDAWIKSPEGSCSPWSRYVVPADDGLAQQRNIKMADKKPNPALMKPLQPSNELAAVVGSSPLPRTEVVSKVWDYIKANNLQNPENKREILADEKLRAVFGGKDKVSMFEMNKHFAQHLS